MLGQRYLGPKVRKNVHLITENNYVWESGLTMEAVRSTSLFDYRGIFLLTIVHIIRSTSI